MRPIQRSFLLKMWMALAVGGLGLAFTGGKSARADDAAAPAPAMEAEKPELVGASACLACHQEQGEAFKSTHHGEYLEKRKGVDFEKSCETCHGPGSLHAGAAGDKTNPGFATIRTFKNQRSEQVSAACFQCHKDAERSHWAGGPHARANVSCVSCHSVHNAKGEHGELVKASVKETCFQCHSDVKGQMRRSAHMPVDEDKMSCTSCHTPHGTGTPKQLKAESVNQSCYQCHQDKRGPNLWEHLPVRENCLNCHNAHGSHHEKMLVAKRAFLCQRCHAGTRHPSTLYDATDITNGNNRIVGQTCQDCHSNIHGSNHPSGKFFYR